MGKSAEDNDAIDNIEADTGSEIKADDSEMNDEKETKPKADVEDDSEEKPEASETPDADVKSEEPKEDAGDSTAASETAATAVAAFPDVQEETADTSENNYTKKSSVKKFFKIFGIVVGATIVCSYLAVSVWFLFHYNYRTYINGVDYSFFSTDEVDSVINTYISDYSLTIKTVDDEEYVIKPEQIGLVITPSTSAKDIIEEQNGFLWLYYIFKDKNYDVTYSASYDKEMLEDLLMTFDFTQAENMERPEDAYVDVEDGKAVIISEKNGNYIDFEKLCAIIDRSLVDGDDVVSLAGTDAYLTASVTSESEEILARMDSLKKLLEMTITFEIDQMSWKLTSEEYGDWLVCSKSGVWVFSDEGIQSYVEQIAEKYDTYGEEKNFKTHDGRTVAIVGEYYGWKIDVEEETAQLKALLKAGESATHTPALYSSAGAYVDGDDIGDSYVEVDMGQQHVYVYMDGRLVMDSDCVTGSVAGGHATPQGIYQILLVKTPALLIGEDYETPVTFWMPFIGSLGIGFHDATWRGKFGGTIYKSGGSHGCVNLPYAAAQELFNIAYVGMPVICYY